MEYMGGYRKFCQRGSNFGLVDKGWEKYHYKRAIIGPLKWRFAGVLMMAQH